MFACGRYEGLDGRVVPYAARRMRVQEVSLGDYVLAGGEAAVLVVVEAVARLLPGVLGNAASRAGRQLQRRRDGRAAGGAALHAAAEWEGLPVPPVLLSGDHAAIARWRRDEALRRTAERRPELLERLAAALDDRDRAVLEQTRAPGVAE